MAEHVTSESILIVGSRPSSRVEWTVKEYAHLERVDERTVRRWIAKGALSVRRTPGGGIRIKER